MQEEMFQEEMDRAETQRKEVQAKATETVNTTTIKNRGCKFKVQGLISKGQNGIGISIPAQIRDMLYILVPLDEPYKINWLMKQDWEVYLRLKDTVIPSEEAK